ncbi:MAG: glycosyl transferase family 1 [Steroidobacteraceae bacterium]|nr:glycosyl transferase family 1 [Steroidobacteraceae bacterium]
MRVLFVSDVYFPRVNGVSTSIRTFRSDLTQLGVETLLVAPAYPQTSGGTADDGDPSIIRVASGGVPMDPEDRRFKRRALRAALNRDLAARVDLVHIHTPFIAHYAAVRFAREHGLPVVATYHTFFEDYLHHYVPILPRAIGRALARRFTLSQCRDVAELISPSAPMRDALLAYGVTTPIEVLPTGMPAESFVRGDGAKFRRQFGIPAGKPLLVYVGRVAYEKNIDFLVRMFAKLRARRPDALLVIAGEGPARESLTRQARELGLGGAVKFIGYLDRHTDLPGCYAAGDVFVFASRTETQGLVLLEAMAQELGIAGHGEEAAYVL